MLERVENVQLFKITSLNLGILSMNQNALSLFKIKAPMFSIHVFANFNTGMEYIVLQI